MKRFLATLTLALTLISCGATTPSARPGPCAPYCLQSDAFPREFTPDQPTEYGFVISGTGAALKEFETLHEKSIHVILVSKDLQFFEHLHPDFDPTSARFTIKDLTFPAFGNYRLFANFAPKGGDATVAYEDIRVGTSTTTRILGPERYAASIDDYNVALQSAPLTAGKETMLNFTVSKYGTPVKDLQPYLGALGHSVILREETLDFLHVHPMEGASESGTISFMATFPKPGKYKVFLEFKHEGTVRTVNFIVSVGQASGSGSVMHAGH